VSRGADIFAKSDADMTAISIAIKEAHKGVLEVLQHEIMQRKEASKPTLLPHIEVEPTSLTELSPRAFERLVEVTEKIEYNDIRGNV
jgi:hypothetical protein